MSGKLKNYSQIKNSINTVFLDKKITKLRIKKASPYF